MFEGFNSNMGNIFVLSNAQSRAVTAENFTGEKGMGGRALHGTGENAASELGLGWKVSPSIIIEPHTVFTLADIKGCGAIKHIWFTETETNNEWKSRRMILRMYWDGCDIPAVESPYDDFFCDIDNNQYRPLNSLAVCNTPKRSMNCFWTMPFRSEAKITMENLSDEAITLYYQIDYTLCELPDNAGYFHARFNSVEKTTPGEDYTVLDGVHGKGQYVGTVMIWKTARTGWWGEGEMKFFIDGDTEFPTICGTGTEDYFLGSYNFDVGGKYTEFCTPYSGVPKVIHPKDGLTDEAYRVGQSICMYRWHINDAIYFQKDIRVTEQALGWKEHGKYCQLEDGISSVAFWYEDNK